ncbi:threonine synthase [Paenibacillus agricola]|uniref:Threonine synthase n=1 Tax=Paenibacillus agricola TaxID=2716264 RepID=A0ABX0J3T2_9BACL|nr:threonine synthase [Paenibacillus agricola]NHN30486.1 threonine synthase [Paenibacillus agricola]
MDKFGLICSLCSRKIPFALEGKCTCGGTWLVEYDLQRAALTFTKKRLRARPASMWKYHELLPIAKLSSIISLGEGSTPLVRLTEWEKKLPLGGLYVKREEQNPTGSFKARGFASALTLINESGIKKVALPSNGNAAAALSAYASRAGMEAYVFLPADCPGLIIEECVNYGAHTYRVDGLIHDAGAIVEEGKLEQGWYNVGTMREPGRVEGKKTMGFELAEQLDWTLPDVIVYPAGGGSGLIGLWRAFHQLLAMGLVTGALPRFVAVQEDGCTPIVSAFWQHAQPETLPAGSPMPTGMRVPRPPNRNLIVSILRETKGTAIAVTREEIHAATAAMGLCGISSSPEGAATWAGLQRLIDSGWILGQDKVVLFNTSHAMKYTLYPTKLQLPLIKSYQDFKSIHSP